MPDINNNANTVPSVPMQYIARAAQKLFGGKPKPETIDEKPTEDVALDKNAIKKAIDTLKKYKDGKAKLEDRIVEEERWWKLRHWEVIKEGNTGDRPEPTSAWLFNSIINKHADAMDNFPEPNVLPRVSDDEEAAKTLSSILPVVFERNEYEQTYSDAWWYKLKHGVVAKGVFWNPELEDGMGDIDIRTIDMLNIFWEPGITDIQDSRNLFVVDLKDNDLIEKEYPQVKGKIGGKHIEIKGYVYDDKVDVSEKSAVIDWYYKKRNSAGKVVLHFCKFIGDTIIYSSESDPEHHEYAERGFYDHGKYPIEFDVLFPEEGTPVGFGFIAVMRSPQMYIDKLSQVILENAVMSAKPRFWAKKSVGINITISVILLFVFLISASAHSGRTDANGGHWNHATGEYHYHSGDYAGRKQSSNSQATLEAIERLMQEHEEKQTGKQTNQDVLDIIEQEAQRKGSSKSTDESTTSQVKKEADLPIFIKVAGIIVCAFFGLIILYWLYGLVSILYVFAIKPFIEFTKKLFNRK